jgi:hypothetical protein
LSRNPLLVLLHQNLQFAEHNQGVMEKLTGIVKLYLLDEILIKHEMDCNGIEKVFSHGAAQREEWMG